MYRKQLLCFVKCRGESDFEGEKNAFAVNKIIFRC